MNTERTFTVILMELNLDKLKLEDSIEQSLNSDNFLEKKVDEIKITLDKLVRVEQSIVKFNELINKEKK